MKHLTSEQRYTIYVMLQNNHSQRKIAETIGKDKSTISREIRRNSDKRNGVYKFIKLNEFGIKTGRTDRFIKNIKIDSSLTTD